MRNAQSISHGLPSMQQHHHAMPLPAPPGQSALSSQNSMGHRPSIDRSHTFPTPPTSASSVLGMGASEGYHWSQPQAMGGSQGNAPMSIDTSLSNTRSMPTTPATTPPGNNIQSMQQYPAVSQSYDRSMYSASAPQQSPYPPTTTNAQDRSLYGGQQGYVKSEMGPPTVRPLMNDPADVKSSNGMLHSGQSGDSVSHQAAEEDQDAEQHDAEYTHDSGAYDASRASYNYNPPAVNSLPGEHSHLSPEMTGSPHQAGSGRATPRTAPQTYYSQQGYNTPPRIQTSSSNLYSVMSNDRGPTNGAPSNDVFATQADMTNPMQNGYPGAAPLLNGSSGSLKRGRDDDDQRSTSGDGPMGLDLKRRKTIIDPQMPSPTYQSPMVQPAPAMQAVPRRR